MAAQASKVQLGQQQATIKAEKQMLQAIQQQQQDGARENLTGLKRQAATAQ